MIDTRDLLSRPWVDMDCGLAVVEGLRRQGQDEAARHLPTSKESGSLLVASGGGRWKLIGTESCLAMEGDVILSPELREGLHVALCVGGGYALTSSKRSGVHLVSVRRIARILGVYRWGAE